jgi:hypothetical protein
MYVRYCQDYLMNAYRIRYVTEYQDISYTNVCRIISTLLTEKKIEFIRCFHLGAEN